MAFLIITDIEVSGIPLHGTNLTQFEEEKQSNCNIKGGRVHGWNIAS